MTWTILDQASKVAPACIAILLCSPVLFSLSFTGLPEAFADQPEKIDFNGDGYSDLAIGVPNKNINGHVGAGMVHIIYGSAAGLSTTGDQRLFQDFPGVADFSEADDHFGEVLTAADFNNDGYTDLAIGVPDEDVGVHVDAGAVNVIYGSPSGLSPTFVTDQIWHQDSAGIEGFPDTSEHFGSALAAGDFNNDGYADLAIGTPLDYVNSVGGAGSVNVIYGSDSGLSSASNQIWHQDSPSVDDSVEFGDHFGGALATGDFNGDGKDDLAVGVPDEGINGQDDAGSVNVIYGSPSGLSAIAIPDQRLFQDSPGIADFSQPNDHFGEALASGDFNGDGYADLGIGTPDEDVGVHVDAGSVNVIYGSPSGLSSASNQIWHQDSVGVEGFPDTSEHFGSAVAAGDFNKDGYDDLAIGTPLDYVNSVGGAGSVNILYGSSSGLSETDDQIWDQSSPNVEDWVEFGDHFGSALAVGDFSNDGYSDLAIGVPEEDINGHADAGSVNIVHGSSSGLSATSVPDQRFFLDSPGIEDFSEPNDHFGASIG